MVIQIALSAVKMYCTRRLEFRKITQALGVCGPGPSALFYVFLSRIAVHLHTKTQQHRSSTYICKNTANHTSMQQQKQLV